MGKLLLMGLLVVNPVNDEEMMLGGIALGEPETSLAQRLGPPVDREENDGDYLPLRLSYRGLVVQLDEQGVGGMISTDGRFCTPAGACPGMPYARVKAIYGAALVTETVNGATVGYVHGDGCWLEFAQRAGRVSAIELACSP